MTNLAQYKTKKEFMANFVECAKSHTHEEMAEKTYDAVNKVYDDTVTVMLAKLDALQTKLFENVDEGVEAIKKIHDRHWKTQFFFGFLMGLVTLWYGQIIYILLMKGS